MSLNQDEGRNYVDQESRSVMAKLVGPRAQATTQNPPVYCRMPTLQLYLNASSRSDAGVTSLEGRQEGCACLGWHMCHRFITAHLGSVAEPLTSHFVPFL